MRQGAIPARDDDAPYGNLAQG
ncbi:MAG: hypothetical protein RLY97_735, partial [Pseudomonadota bacterium]